MLETGRRYLVERILKLKKERNAIILAHNYQLGEVQDIADFVGDSLGLSQNTAKTEAEEIIVGMEAGLIYRLRKENPGKKFIPVSEQAVCPTMKLTTLEDILRSLEKMSHPVKVPEEIRLRAKAAVERMIQV